MLTMDNFAKHFFQLCPNHERGVLVAISGGADSVCLLHLLHSMGIKIEAAHVNYGLRGDESNHDMLFVEAICRQLNIVLHSRSTNQYSLMKLSSNLQDAARIYRYRFFNEVLQQNKFAYIATAHHKNDQAETVLYNITRGKIKNGLVGIQELHGNIVRPLLHFDRSSIENYLHEHRLTYRTDSTNLKNTYHRNIIRNIVIPQLKSINQGIIEHLSQLAQHALFANQAIRMYVEKIKREAIADADCTGFVIYINKLGDLDEFRPHILYEILRQFGFNFIQCSSMCNVQSIANGAVFESETHIAHKHMNHYRIQLKDAQVLPDIIIDKLPFRAKIMSSFYTIYKTKYHPEFDLKVPNTWYINLPEGAVISISSPQHGDRMYPLGLGGSKKISDILIDRKTPGYAKSEVRKVLINGETAALIPVCIDERFKITEHTDEMLVIKKD